MYSLKPQLPKGVALALESEIKRLSTHLSTFSNVTILTGAGISTESGLSDYRSPGKPKPSRLPVQHQEYIKYAAIRRRYWARSFVGFPFLSKARPSLAHHGLAALHDRAGSRFQKHITQNVDGLLQAARLPTRSLVELHGSVHKLICRHCGGVESRAAFQTRLSDMNGPWARELGTYPFRADGDADLPDDVISRFCVPKCATCDEDALIPDLVFHGGQVPAQVSDEATRIVRQSDALLVVGSTVTPYSAFRLVKLAKSNGAFLACINFGDTRADDVFDVKIEALVGNAVARLADAQLSGGFHVPGGFEVAFRRGPDSLVSVLEL